MTAYTPRRPHSSVRCQIRGIDYHVARWGNPDGVPVFLLHGWMDCAASFQFLIDAAPATFLDYNVIAPDWRGFGYSGWASEGYWFPDYLADLDALIARWSPDWPVALVGHSMGGMVAGLYAGVRPEAVSHLVSLEGFGLPSIQADQAPSRYRRWLDELQSDAPAKPLLDYADVTSRLCRNNPRLSPDKAAWLAPHLSEATADGVRYRADPRHRWVNPVLYRLEEAKACWRQATAKVLWLAGNETKLLQWLQESESEFAERRACLSNFCYASISDAGHNLHHDNPLAVAERISSFLRS